MAAKPASGTSPGPGQLALDGSEYEVVARLDKNGMPRRYELAGDKVPSVTTILGVLNKEALVGWAFGLAIEGTAAIATEGYPIPTDPQMVRKMLVDRGYGWWQKRDEAGLRGTRAHELMEMLMDDKVPAISNYEPHERGYVRAVASWWAEQAPLLEAREVVCGSKVYGYAGRFDYLRKGPDGLILGDLKTIKLDRKGNPNKPYETHHLQLAGYQLATEEQYGLEIAGTEIVTVCENGAWQVTAGVATPEDFLGVLAAHRSLAMLKDRLAAA